MLSNPNSQPAAQLAASDQESSRGDVVAQAASIPIHGSNEFRLSTADLPSAVYRSVIFAFAWMIFAAWISFGKAGRPDFVIFISGLIFFVLLAIPTILHAANPAHPHAQYKNLREFLSSPVETATGTVTGREVWLQIATIPFVLAFGATAFGIVHLLEM